MGERARYPAPLGCRVEHEKRPAVGLVDPQKRAAPDRGIQRVHHCLFERLAVNAQGGRHCPVGEQLVQAHRPGDAFLLMDVPDRPQRHLQLGQVIYLPEQVAKKGRRYGDEIDPGRKRAGHSYAGSLAGTVGLAASVNLANWSWTTSHTLPVGPCRCLATMISARLRG